MLQVPTPKIVHHLVAPGYEQARGLPLIGETIQEFLDRNGWEFRVPTICVCNGAPILRAEWAVTPIELGSVNFLSRPHGGGGSSGGGSKALQVAGIVGMIALAAIAPWAAGALAPVLGITSTAGIAALTAGIALGGGLLISTLVKMVAGGQNDTTEPEAAQVYSLSGAGNSARPLAVIPVNYGYLKLIPDYGSTPWSEYISNDQILNAQLTLGVGKHHIHQLLIDDTVLWDEDTGFNPSFSNVTVQFCDPGEPFTLFPTNIQTTAEVSGQELPGPISPGFNIGGFIANASGTLTNKLVVDIAFPGGIFFLDSQNRYTTMTVTFLFQYRSVDNAGTPTSGWSTLLNFAYTNMTKTPQRLSYPVDVAPGRYEVRGNRTNIPNGGSVAYSANTPGSGDSSGSVSYTIQQNTGDDTQQDQVMWLGLRSYIVGSVTYPYEQQIGIRMKADAQLTNQSARQFGVLATRILPVWDVDEEELVELPTTNPIWAFWDAATNSLYGANRPISKVDFQTVVEMALAADTRGDSFNYSFKDFVTIPDAFDTILASARSKHCWIGDVLSVVRDEWREIPSMLLTDHQIVRGSLEIVSIFNDETGVDCVIGEFLNENTWRPAEIQFPPNTLSFTAENPKRVRIPGITDPDQLLREIAFVWNQSQLRRTKVTLQTGHEGRMLKLMSAIKVQSHLPRTWGQAGEIVSKDVDGVTLLTNRTLVFDDAAANYIEFRDKRGRYFGPVLCDSVISNPKKVILDADDLALVETQIGMTLDEALDRMDGAEPPVFVLGKASTLSRTCMLLTGRPNGDTVDLTLVVDSEDVHNPDVGDVGDFPEPPFILNPAIPVATLLYATFRVGIAEPILDASWWPAPGALGYKAQVSYNEGESWQQIYEGVNPGFSLPVNPASLILRVAAFSNIHGPWVQVTVEAPTIIIAPGVVAPSSMIEGLKDYVMNIIKDNDDIARSIRQIIASATAELDAGNYTDHAQINRNLVAVTGNLSATFSEVILVAIGPGSAIATSITELEASVDDLSATVTVTSIAVATIEGNLAASWGVKLDVNDYITSIELLSDGTSGSIVFNTDNFSIAKPGVLSPITMFSLQTVGGVTTMALRGDFIADGIITAQHIAANSITASMIQALAINATHIQSNSITTAMLQAGSINTAALAVNSVSLANIIAGSVTAEYYYGSGAATASGVANTVVVSGSVTILSGNASFHWDASVQMGPPLDPSYQSCSIGLYVDGILRRQWVWWGDNKMPISVMAYVPGLGPGGHSWSIQSIPTGTGAGFGIGDGVVLIRDLRR